MNDESIEDQGKYRKLVKTAMMFAVETRAVKKKAQEKKLDVAEMRMSRWTCGVTK